jgi:AcrR family transcriptional regulator
MTMDDSTRCRKSRSSDGSGSGESGGGPPARFSGRPRREDGTAAAHRLRRIPRQARSRETVAAILQAAAEVIAAEGLARASTNRIAARAGVSIGSLYQYFPDKEAIRARLLEQHHREVEAIVDRAMALIDDPAVPFARALRGLLDELIALHRAQPALMRALSEEVPHPPQARARREEEARGYARRMEAALRRRTPIAPRDPVAASFVLVRAVESLSRWLAHEAPPDLRDVALVDEVVAMLAGYVEGAAGDAGGAARG